MKSFERIKDVRSHLKIGYLAVTLATTLAATAVGCMSVISSCEPSSRYFEKTPMSVVFAILLVLSLLLPFAVLLIFKKEDVDATSANQSYKIIARYSNILPALLSAILAVFALVYDGLGQWSNAVMVLAAVVCIFFVLKLFSRSTVLTVLTGFGVFALCAIIITSLYLDLVIELNSHFKLLTQFGAVGMILGTIADMRSMLSVSPSNRKIGIKGYLLLKSVSIAMCAVCSLVIIIYFLEGNKAFEIHYLFYSLLYLAHAISSTAEAIGALRAVV